MDPEASALVQGALRAAQGVLPARAKLGESPAKTYALGVADAIASVQHALADEFVPIPMVLFCPACGRQHIDGPEPETGWTNPPHKSHLCVACHFIWRPANVATVGVIELSSHGLRDSNPQIRSRAAEGLPADIMAGELQVMQRDARAWRMLREIRGRGWMVMAHYDVPGPLMRTRWVLGSQTGARYVEREGMDDPDALQRLATDILLPPDPARRR